MNLKAMMFWLAVTTAGAAHTCDATGSVEVIAGVTCGCGLAPADAAALSCTGATKFCAVSSSGYGICGGAAIAACEDANGAIAAGAGAKVVKAGAACLCGETTGAKIAFPGESCSIVDATPDVGTVTKVTCTGDGTTVTADYGCDCGLNADGSILNCQKDEHCTVSATGYGVCEADGAAVLANCATDSADITTSGVVKAGRPCKCGSSPIAYALPTEKCTITGTAGSVLPACTATAGTATDGKACHCGTATCTASEFCKSATTSTCYTGIKKCQAQNSNKALVETTDICACGNNAKLCTPGEGCSVTAAGVGACGTSVNQCTKTNGSAHTWATTADNCACGTGTGTITATGKGCDSVTTAAGEVKATPRTDCASQDQKTPNTTDCACGNSAICTTAGGLYCKGSDNECVAESALPACSVNGTFKESTECLCGTAACGGSNANKYCNGTSCQVAAATTACTADTAAGADGCLCGKNETCAVGKKCSGAATDNGLCYTDACADDGWTAATADCLCGTAICAATKYCLKHADAYMCSDATVGAGYTAAKKTAVDAKVCETCEECPDTTPDANNAACVGQFVANMAVAMNM